MASWSSGSGVYLPFFPFSFFLFFWGLSHSKDDGMGLPIGLFLFQLGGCPASPLAVAGNGCRVLQARPFFGTVDLFLFETLLFPSYATRCRYDVPGGLASCSGLLACGRCLESPSVVVLAFQSSLFLVEGSSDGLAAGDRFLPPGRMCLTHSVLDGAVASALSQSESWLFLLLWA